MGYLLSRLVLVRRLSIDPGLVAPAGWSVPLAVGGILLAAAGGLALATLRSHPAPSFAVLWFLLQLMPTSSIVARTDVVSERHLYLAMLGPALLVGLAVEAFRQRGGLASAAATGATAAIVVSLAVVTHLRNRDYASEVTLWAAAVRLTPDNPRALNNLGWSWHRAGCPAEARAAYEAALRLDPRHPTAGGNLAGLPPPPAEPCALGWDAVGLTPPAP
jgi:tetratricopeptide (TPR) repeat protein